jgi:hypothetical protein
MGSLSQPLALSALLVRYPTDIRMSCGALRTPPARRALQQHDTPACHALPSDTKLLMASLRPSHSAATSLSSRLTNGHAAVSTAFPRNIHHSSACNKAPSPVCLHPHPIHSAPAARHPSRGVRRLCSHRATNDMGIPPILADPHTTHPTLVQRHRHPSRLHRAPCRAWVCCACRNMYASLGSTRSEGTDCGECSTHDGVIVCGVPFVVAYLLAALT